MCSAVLLFVALILFFDQSEAKIASYNFTLPSFGKRPKLPLAIETVPVNRVNAQTVFPNGVDCSTSTSSQCNQGAWSNFGLALSGLIPKRHLCVKYSPQSSCISSTLALCLDSLEETTKVMLLSLARIIVSWCSDDKKIISAMDKHSSCYSVALLDSITSRGCLSSTVPAHISGSAVPRASHQQMALSKLLHDYLGSYQSTTILCLHETLEKFCGKEAADLALGPAIDHIRDETKDDKKPAQYNSATIALSQTLLLFIAIWTTFLTFRQYVP